MKELEISAAKYRIVAVEHHGVWTAHAERVPTGHRYGVEYTAPSEAVAIDLVARWLEWQAEHAAALESLQQAERAYHRTVAGSAFANPTEGPTPLEMQKEWLDEVEAARLRLDDVRARKPE